jgi:hypothetical protein
VKGQICAHRSSIEERVKRWYEDEPSLVNVSLRRGTSLGISYLPILQVAP